VSGSGDGFTSSASDWGCGVIGIGSGRKVLSMVSVSCLSCKVRAVRSQGTCGILFGGVEGLVERCWYGCSRVGVGVIGFNCRKSQSISAMF